MFCCFAIIQCRFYVGYSSSMSTWKHCNWKRIRRLKVVIKASINLQSSQSNNVIHYLENKRTWILVFDCHQEMTVNYDHSCFSVNRVAKGFSVTRGGTQIINVMRDRAQMSRERRDVGWQRDAWVLFSQRVTRYFPLKFLCWWMSFETRSRDAKNR